MNKRILSTLLLAAAAVLTTFSVAQAWTGGVSISVAFGRDDNGKDWSLDPMTLYGVPAVQSENWNNANGASDTLDNLVQDNNGVATTTNASVTWHSAGSWTSTVLGRGESNNNFVTPDPNFDLTPDGLLLAAYLDNNPGNPTIVTISGLPSAFATYDVYIYTLGGVPNRGGDYYVNDPNLLNPKHVVAGGGTNPKNPCQLGKYSGPDWQEALGTDPAFGMDDWGNYVVFRGMSGDVTIEADATFGGAKRAPINAVEIVKNP